MATQLLICEKLSLAIYVTEDVNNLNHHKSLPVIKFDASSVQTYIGKALEDLQVLIPTLQQQQGWVNVG